MGIRIEVHSHQQVQGNAEPGIRQVFNPDHFRYILAAHGIMGGGKWERNKDPHSLVVIGPPGMEVDALFRGIDADRHVFKMLIARFRRPNTEGLGDFCASAPPFIRKLLGCLSHESALRAIDTSIIR